MSPSFFARLFVVVLATLAPAFSAEIETVGLDWEEACGGSCITVTKVDGKTALIEAFAQHFAESRAWSCHFVDGKIVSATYRHHVSKHTLKKPDEEILTEWICDCVNVFHFPDHNLLGLDPEFENELKEILARTNKLE